MHSNVKGKYLLGIHNLTTTIPQIPTDEFRSYKFRLSLKKIIKSVLITPQDSQQLIIFSLIL